MSRQAGLMLSRRHASSWFDAVTLDMLLPDMGGFTALKLIRAESQNPDMSIVALTQVADPEIAGAFSLDGWLVKPVLEEELIGTLERTGIRAG
jgi:CheY-like chemotaxis protein